MTAPDNAPVLAFVEQFGVPVFPCVPNEKGPLTPHGFKDASCDATQIQQWTEQFPQCNWAMPTGALSGFAVLDVDIRPDQGKDGDEVLRLLEEAHGTLPETAQVLTPSGGRHYWFRTNGNAIQSGTDKLGRGLDVKAEGGYVVIPPSTIDGRPYAFEASSDPADVGFAEMPAWLVTMLTVKRAPPKTDTREHGDKPAALLDNVADGNALHDSLRDLAARYAALGMGFEEICKLLETGMLASRAPRDERWNDRLGDIPKLVNSAIEKFRSSEKPSSWELPLAISGAEWETSRLAPDCVVENLLFADVGVLIAPGGTGKTTFVLMVAVHVALGLDVLGLHVERSGPVIILTSEDSREMDVARLRRIAESKALSPTDIERLRERIIISDVSGSGLRLTTVVNDSVRPDDVVDSIAIALADIKPALIVIDPAVSFGVGESRVNDAEQGLIEAARRIRRALNCAVLYVHHTGKANARDGAVDQYAGRGGSAFADGARMVLVLQSLSEEEWKKKTGLPLSNGEQGLILARPKMSYCLPQQPLFIRRKGYAFEQVTGIESAEHNPKADIEQLVRLVAFELGAGNQHSKRSIEALYAQAGMTRQQLRDALAGALASGKLAEKPLPPDQRQGGRKSYLAPAEPVATAPNNRGAVGAQEIGNSGNGEGVPYCAVPTAPPYRENKDGAVERARPVPLIPLTAPNDNGAVGAVGAVPPCPRCAGEGCAWCIA